VKNTGGVFEGDVDVVEWEEEDDTDTKEAKPAPGSGPSHTPGGVDVGSPSR
jgi:hypothetical protein